MDAFIGFWMSMTTQVKLFHWATTEFSKHKALDDLHSTLQTRIDDLIEAYIGLNRKTAGLSKFTLKSTATSDCKMIMTYLEKTREEIRAMLEADMQSELKNIMEDILAAYDRAIYLSRLA